MTQHSTSFRAFRPLISLALAACALSANAALVTWSAPSAIVGDADVRTNGALVMAYNLGGAQSATVNGVTFQNFFVAASEAVHTVGNARLEVGNVLTPTNFLANYDNPASQGPFSALSADYQALLRSSAGNDLADRKAVLTLSGLVEGQTYEFQTWFNDSTLTGCCAFGLSLSDLASDLSANVIDLSPNLLRNPSNQLVEGGLGQFALGTFTADSTGMQAFVIRREEIAGGLNGFQLRQLAANTVPLPGSLPLVLAALLAAAVTVRPSRFR